MFGKSRTGSLIVIVVLVVYAPLVVFAHKGATGVVKERMEAMKDVAANMKILGGMMKGEVAFNSADAQRAAKTIADHAAKVPELFPQGSIEKPTEALPVIWTDWSEFTKSAEDLRRGAEGLITAAANASTPADFKDPFVEMGRTCKGCHEKFRLKK